MRLPSFLSMPLWMIGAAAFFACCSSGSASASPEQAAARMQAVIREAYFVSGWSWRDAQALAEGKVALMLEGKHPGGVPGFVAQGPSGELSATSNGTALAKFYLEDIGLDRVSAHTAIMMMRAALDGRGYPVELQSIFDRYQAASDAERMQAIIQAAYVSSGWSSRDAQALAEGKVALMLDQKRSAEVPGFVAQDPSGELSETSNGIALAKFYLEDTGLDGASAHMVIMMLHAAMTDSVYPVELRHVIEDGELASEVCMAYRVRYRYCRNGLTVTESEFWRGDCVVNLFETNPCIDIGSLGCSCPGNQECGLQYMPAGNCKGVPAGSCIRLVGITVEPVHCSEILGDNEGGCADCAPPLPIGSDCPVIILGTCHFRAGCPSCPGQ